MNNVNITRVMCAVVGWEGWGGGGTQWGGRVVGQDGIVINDKIIFKENIKYFGYFDK